MQSAPRTIAEHIVITLRPGFAAPGRSPRSTHSSTSSLSPRRCASNAGSITLSTGTARSSSKTTTADSFTIRVTS
jgi:hypothetical protein